MKYISHTLLLSLVTLLLALAACQDGNDFGEGYTACTDCGITPPYIYVDSKERTEIEFAKEGGTETVLLSSNVGWEVKSQPEWISKIDPNNGTGSNSTVTVYLTAKANSADERTGDIVFTTTDESNLTATVTVLQHGVGPYTNVTSEKVIELESPDKTTKDIEIEVVSNEQWTATFSEETNANASSWGWSISQTTRSGKGKATITISNNTTEVEHKATVIIKGTDSKKEIPVTITQPGITLSLGSLNTFPAAGGSQELTVNCNSDKWEADSDDKNICTVERNNNKALTVSCSENTDTKSRETEIIVEAGEVQRKVTVKQEAAKPAPHTRVISPSNGKIEFGLASDTKTITIDSNEEWETELSGDDTSWIKTTSDVSKGIVTVISKANPTETKHEATITIKGKTSGDAPEVKLSQEAIELKVDQPTAFSNDGGTPQILNVICNTTWTASQSNQSWCTVSPTSPQTGIGTITVTVTEKNDATTSRSAKFTVKAGDVERQIEVTQNGTGPYIYISGNDIYTDGNGKKCMTLGNGTGTKTISVSTNDGPFKVISSNEDWCKGPKGDISGSFFTLEVEANSTLSKRTATITVKSKSGKTDTLTVTQKAGNIGVEEYE